MDCDNKVDGKECSPSPKHILKTKIITKRNFRSDLEEHQIPLDLSDKSKVNANAHGSKEFITEHFEPQRFYQTPTIEVIYNRKPNIPLPFRALNHAARPVSPTIVSPHISQTISLPLEQISPGSSTAQLFTRSNSLTIEPVSPVRFTSQIRSRSQSFSEDPGSPDSISHQSHTYSEDELQRYPKGTARRPRILATTLSEEEASQRVRIINNESSRRYRQRKHLAQKQLKEEEDTLLTRQVQLKEQLDKLKHESDLYYSYFRRNYF